VGKVQIYRNGVATIELPLQDAVFTRALQGDHKLVFSLRSPAMLDLRIGDTLTYKGEVMTINRDPKRIKVSSLQYDTEVTFEGHRHTLSRFLLKDEGAISFDYFGSLDEFMYMFLESINGDDSGWTLGDIDTSEPVGLMFDKTDCFSALNMIAQAFGFEWQIRNKVISVQKTVGLATTIELAYGKDNGLYNLTREAIENGAIVNRAYGYGGSNNLPQGYSSKALRLTTPLEDAASIALYGVREGAYSDDSIYPQRTSTATAVGQINEGTFTLDDSTIDFDLDGQRISGTEAKIVFKSGALNGQEFKILSYNHQHKRIRYEANKDSNGALTPSGLRVAEVGDSYTLIGIRMPSTYVDAALQTLSEKTQEYLNSNKVPRVVYSLSIDILDAKRKGVYPNEGDFIHVTDTDLAIDDNLRVTSVSYPALFPEVLVPGMQFTCEVGNDVTYTFLQKIEKDIEETKEVVTQVTRESWEADRRNALAVAEFRKMVFDPDGNLQQPMMEALVGYFGTPSQLFDLFPAPTFTLGEDEFTLSATQLIHKIYEIAGLGYTWDLPALSQSGLVPEKAYYLSARCSRVALTGAWVLSETAQATDAEAGYWHFNLGVLSSVIDGERSFRATKGFTLVSGGQIETDMITAYMINVVKLFAQEIEATNLKVTGNSMIGDFEIDSEGLKYFYSSSAGNSTLFRVNYGNLVWDHLYSIPGLGSGSAKFKAGSPGTNEGIVNVESTENHPANKGIKINMLGTNKRAIEVNNGRSYFGDDIMLDPDNTDILIGGKLGISGTYEYNRGGGIWELEFEKGILVGQRLVSAG